MYGSLYYIINDIRIFITYNQKFYLTRKENSSLQFSRKFNVFMKSCTFTNEHTFRIVTSCFIPFAIFHINQTMLFHMNTLIRKEFLNFIDWYYHIFSAIHGQARYLYIYIITQDCLILLS